MNHKMVHYCAQGTLSISINGREALQTNQTETHAPPHLVAERFTIKKKERKSSYFCSWWFLLLKCLLSFTRPSPPFCRQAPTRPLYLAANLQGRPLRRDWQFTLQFTARGKYIHCINNVRKSKRATSATQLRLSANKHDLENFIKPVNTMMDLLPMRNSFPLTTSTACFCSAIS